MNKLRYSLLPNLKLIALIFTFIMMSSCATPMTNIKQNKSFTFNSIQQDHIVFGGLISDTEKWNNAMFERYSNIARESLSLINKDINFRSNDNIILNIGYGELINLINIILENITEYKEALITLSNTEKDSRYIIFSKILTDDILKSNYGTKTEKTYTTERKITVFTAIYDLKNLNSVWSGKISTTMTNTNTNPHNHDDNSLADLFTTFVEDTIYGNYPEPPKLESLISKTFSDIGDNITNRPCNEIGYINCFMRSISRF